MLISQLISHFVYAQTTAHHMHLCYPFSFLSRLPPLTVAISDTAPRQLWLLMMTSSLFYSVCASIAFAHPLLRCLIVRTSSMYGSNPCSFTPSVCLLLPDCLSLPRLVSLYLVFAFTSRTTVVLTCSQFLVVGPSNHANSPDASALDDARHDASWSRLGAGSPS